jgi:hypothetical protein
MACERLDLLLGSGQSSNPEAFVSERLEQIDHQLPDILRRHKRIRDAVLLVYCALLVYLLSMVAIAAAKQPGHVLRKGVQHFTGGVAPGQALRVGREGR